MTTASRLPEFVTFTGVDTGTPIAGLERLSGRYPVEWGVLFSPKRQGVDPRYPDEATVRRLAGTGLRFAAHLCGSYAREIVEGGSPMPFHGIVGAFSRIQVNHADPDPVRIGSYCERVWGARGIAQSRSLDYPASTQIDWLYDCSSGFGKSPEAWARHPGEDRLVGYAGGIGPDNAAEVLGAVDRSGPFWLDMESRVRTGDRFDLALCERVLESVYGPRD